MEFKTVLLCVLYNKLIYKYVGIVYGKLDGFGWLISCFVTYKMLHMVVIKAKKKMAVTAFLLSRWKSTTQKRI